MNIKTEKTQWGNFVLDIRGRWVTDIVVTRMKEIEKNIPPKIKTDLTVGYLERGMFNNEIFVTFSSTATQAHVDEIVGRINVALNGYICSSFTSIDVNPYKVEYTGDVDSLTLAMEIAKETECHFNAGGWISPYQFHPSDNVQYNKVTELLDLFGMSYN